VFIAYLREGVEGHLAEVVEGVLGLEEGRADGEHGDVLQVRVVSDAVAHDVVHVVGALREARDTAQGRV